MTRRRDKVGDTPTWHNLPPVAGVIQPIRPELFQPQVKVLRERERKGGETSPVCHPPPKMYLVPPSPCPRPTLAALAMSTASAMSPWVMVQVSSPGSASRNLGGH